ncbi:MAG: ATP-dependent Clp protease proteolytic subunit [Myxococcales bacterium]|nr:ATP-dependent Clp protease proteolytic subunit [Myxococcales bacterium]
MSLTDLQSIYVPSVIENTHRGERQFDLFSRLLLDRIVFIGGEITNTGADVLIAQFLFLESMDPEKEIHLYINSSGISPGRPIDPALAVYDTLQYIRSPVSTICVGQAANVAALLLASGAKGKRFTLPNARIHLHQPVGWFQGQATDVDIQAKELTTIKNTLTEALARHTGRTIEQVREDTDRDKFLRGKEAVDYGIVDQVIARKDVAGEKPR